MIFHLVMYIIAVYGAARTVSRESIFEWFRKLTRYKKPFSCTDCMSFWLGLAGSFFMPVIFCHLAISVVVYGLICYVASCILNSIINY